MTEKLPDEIYDLVISTIKAYDHFKEKHENIPTDGEAIGFVKATNDTGISDPTGRKGIISAEISKKIKAVDDALSMIPKDYRQGVKEKIMYRVNYPDNVTRNTYTKYKNQFIYDVAVNLSLF